MALYAPVRHYEFLNYDDDYYVSNNPHVLGGFTREDVAYSLTHFRASNWHPLTWFSHMADVEIWGKNPGGHHITNVVLHTLNAVLLFLVFSSMTGALWRSAFIAAVFAWHPLHVESVAWIAERKDILCALFWILTMGAYVNYVRRPAASKYLLVAFLFLLGLMSKPMIVTLPLVLLLLDYWPLGRAGLTRADARIWWHLFLEKTPLLVFALLISRLTISTQHRTGALKSVMEFPLGLRISNVPVSYVDYVWKTLWPTKLAVFYPLPSAIAIGHAIGAAVVLLLITGVVMAAVKRAPYLSVGWLWFVGTLVPVIGLVQVGSQALADRYMYIPLIGLTTAAVWGGWELMKRTDHASAIATVIFLISGLLMIQATARQITYWRNSVTLFQQTISVTSNNGIAQGNLSSALLEKSQAEAAADHAREAIRILPDQPLGYVDLGMAMLMEQKTTEAIQNLEKALQFQPNNPETHHDLGGVFVLAGRVDEAIPHFYETLRLNPDHILALKALAWIRATQPSADRRDAKEAVQLADRAVRLTSGKDAQALDVQAAALAEAGHYDEAAKAAEEARALALTAGKTKLADEINQRLDLYRLGLPYRTMR